MCYSQLHKSVTFFCFISRNCVFKNTFAAVSESRRNVDNAFLAKSRGQLTCRVTQESRIAPSSVKNCLCGVSKIGFYKASHVTGNRECFPMGPVGLLQRKWVVTTFDHLQILERFDTAW